MAKRNLTSRQIAALIMKGVLRPSGSGKERKLVYNKNADATSARNFGRAAKRLALGSGKGNTRPTPAKWSNIHDPQSPNYQRRAEKNNPAREHLPTRAGRFEGRSLNGKLGKLTRAERITLGNQRLEQFIGKQAAAVRARKTAGRKEMAAKFPGRYADTGKPFKAGDKIYYDGAANQRPGRLSLTRRNIEGFKPAADRGGKLRYAAAHAVATQRVVREEAGTSNVSRFRRRGNRAGRNGRTDSALTAEFKDQLKKLGLTGRGKSKAR